MRCLVCNKGEAIKHYAFGYLPCKECQERHRSYGKPNKQIEFTTADIKDQRKAYSKDIVQPFRKGDLSKEYIEQYGTKGIKVNSKEVKKARKVWQDTNYYKD
jgi:hypothetical protein